MLGLADALSLRWSPYPGRAIGLLTVDHGECSAWSRAASSCTSASWGKADSRAPDPEALAPLGTLVLLGSRALSPKRLTVIVDRGNQLVVV